MTSNQDIRRQAKADVRNSYADIYQLTTGWGGPDRTALARSTSTGIVSLDAALGGKLPSGAVEIYGEASTGKTTLLYEIIATAQKSGMQVALCPSEYLDVPYMRVFGIDLDSLLLITGNCGESVANVALDFLSRPRALVALDSATSIRPLHDRPGMWMTMIHDFLERSLEGMSAGSCIVAVNQVRVRRSIHPDRFFVNGEVDSTARKIVGQFSTRLELSRGEERPQGYTMRVNVVANTTSRPAVVLELPVRKGAGVDTMRDLLVFGMSVGVVKQTASWFHVDDKYKLGSGIAEAVRILETTPEISEYLLDRVMTRA